MRAALVGASDFEAGHFAGHAYDLVVAVDGGYAHLVAAGAAPDIVVGDFDSLGYVPQAPDVRRFPPEKDESDMELACRAAVRAGCDELVLYGCLGRRLDHTIANLQVMMRQARRGLRAFAVGEGYAVAALSGRRPSVPVSAAAFPADARDAGAPPARASRLAFDAVPPELLRGGPYGNFVSVFAWGGPARGVFERGLKYGLEDAVLPDDVSLGLSNEFIGRPARIGVAQGGLIVTFPLVAWDYLRNAGDGGEGGAPCAR